MAQENPQQSVKITKVLRLTPEDRVEHYGSRSNADNITSSSIKAELEEYKAKVNKLEAECEMLRARVGEMKATKRIVEDEKHVATESDKKVDKVGVVKGKPVPGAEYVWF